MSFKNSLPGGVHYGLQLKVVRGKYKKYLGNCLYFDNTYFAADLNYVSVNEFDEGKEYYIFLVLYNFQWRVFDYICI